MRTSLIRLRLQQLQRRFSPRRFRLGATNSTQILGGESEVSLCLVGREICLFTILDASQVPAKQRKAFATLAIRRIAPFTDIDFDAAWSATGVAAVWYWSRSRIHQLAADLPGKRKRFAAEALYVGGVSEQTTELIQLTNGVEGRVWLSGHIKASRWWPIPPSPNDWREFLRGAGLLDTTSAELPDLRECQISNRAWSAQPTDTPTLRLTSIDQYLPKISAVLAATILVVAGIEIGAGARAQFDVYRTKSASTKLDAPLKRILDARELADKSIVDITKLTSLHNYPSTSSLIANISRLLPATDWQIKQWNQPTPDRLELILILPNSKPEQLVSTLESSPLLQNITTELGRENEIIIKATITPLNSDLKQ